MRRREFISLLGGAAAWPLAARAQQPMPVVGFLHSASPGPFASALAAFRQGLSETGYIEGQNVAIEYRWAEGQYDRLPALAADLVRRQVTVIAAIAGSAPAQAAKATASIPIVMEVGGDPVRLGLVASFNRPGGNVTGVSNLNAGLEPKRLSLLREVARAAGTVGVLLNPTFPPSSNQLKDIEEAARAIGQQLDVLRASTDGEVEAAFQTIAQHRIPALLVASDPFFNARRDKLAILAARAAVPAMYSYRDYVVAGGLMSYGIDLPDVYHQVGRYVGRILKGEKPEHLPVMQSTKFEFVLNLKTSKALGVKFSDDLLSLADEVIE
jgi:putative ABC transport system substrate-binding protein